MPAWPKQLAIGVTASVLVHIAFGALLWLARSVPEPPLPEPALVMVDIDQAPEAAKAHTPTDDPAAADTDDSAPLPSAADEPDTTATDTVPAAATVDPTIPTTPEPPEPPEPPERPEPPEPPDAGVPEPPDAGVPDARPPPHSDAMAVALLPADAGVEDAGAGGHGDDARRDDIDGGGAALVASANAGDAGTRVSAAAKIDGGGGGGSTGGVPALPGATANLLTYVPKVERVAVMIRFERMRGTEWIRHTEAVLEPMPDYQLLFSGSRVKPGDAIDTLVISSSSPRDMTATTLGVKVGGWTGARLRAYMNRPNAPVTWVAVRGGVLGKRHGSRRARSRDPRVFLMPYPGWVVLARPAYLGKLLAPSPVSVASAVAAAADLPPWLARIRSIEHEAGIAKTGPALLMTMNGFQKTLTLPLVGTLPGPTRITLALEVAAKGFFVRGELVFASPRLAAAFVKEIEQFKDTFVGTSIGKRALGQVHAYNALAQLSLKQGGGKVGFSTSISISDGRLMMQLAAVQTRRLFNAGSPPRRSLKLEPTPAPRRAKPKPAPRRAKPKPTAPAGR